MVVDLYNETTYRKEVSKGRNDRREKIASIPS